MWTGACDAPGSAPGCGSQCVANIFPLTFVRFAASDASIVNDRDPRLCVRITEQIALLAALANGQRAPTDAAVLAVRFAWPHV